MIHDTQQDLQATRLSIDDRLAACEAAINELRGGTLTVRRLSICDDHGIERAAIDVSKDSAVLKLSTIEPGPTCVELFAHEPCDGEGPHIGVAITRDGDVVGEFGFVGDNEPRVWLDVTRNEA